MPKVVLQKVANQLDSFDVLKLKEAQYLQYMEGCDSMVSAQHEIIIGSDTIIYNKNRQIDMMATIESHYKENVELSLNRINVLEKQNKAHKIKNKVILIGGCILTVGLTTGLILALLQ